MLELFEFAFMSILQGSICCNSEEYNNQILTVRFIGLELLF